MAAVLSRLPFCAWDGDSPAGESPCHPLNQFQGAGNAGSAETPQRLPVCRRHAQMARLPSPPLRWTCSAGFDVGCPCPAEGMMGL